VVSRLQTGNDVALFLFISGNFIVLTFKVENGISDNSARIYADSPSDKSIYNSMRFDDCSSGKSLKSHLKLCL